LAGHHDRFHRDVSSAAFSISRATGSGFDTITTSEAPLITTVSLACARSAVLALARCTALVAEDDA
jgi:hypothetical protein